MNDNWVQERQHARWLARFEDGYTRGRPRACWEWEGRRYAKGYGSANCFGERYAHRVAWRLAHDLEPIPEGLEIHHDCENPSCVNPAHLMLLTSEEHKRMHDLARGSTCGNRARESHVIQDA